MAHIAPAHTETERRSTLPRANGHLLPPFMAVLQPHIAPDTVHTGEVATVTEIQRCGSDSSKDLIREEINALLIVTEK